MGTAYKRGLKVGLKISCLVLAGVVPALSIAQTAPLQPSAAVVAPCYPNSDDCSRVQSVVASNDVADAQGETYRRTSVQLLAA